MDRILADRQLRKWFTITFVLLVAFAGIVRWLALKDYPDPSKPNSTLDPLARGIEGFITSSVVAFIVALVIVLGTRDLRKAQDQLLAACAEGIGHANANFNSPPLEQAEAGQVAAMANTRKSPY